MPLVLSLYPPFSLSLLIPSLLLAQTKLTSCIPWRLLPPEKSTSNSSDPLPSPCVLFLPLDTNAVFCSPLSPLSASSRCPLSCASLPASSVLGPSALFPCPGSHASSFFAPSPFSIVSFSRLLPPICVFALQGSDEDAEMFMHGLQMYDSQRSGEMGETGKQGDWRAEIVSNRAAEERDGEKAVGEWRGSGFRKKRKKRSDCVGWGEGDGWLLWGLTNRRVSCMRASTPSLSLPPLAPPASCSLPLAGPQCGEKGAQRIRSENQV